MFRLVGIFTIFCFVRSSLQLECSTQTVTLDENTTEFRIDSDPNDLSAKNCKYSIAIPKYFVPSIISNAYLTGDNKITARQYSEYGGAVNYDLSGLSSVDLAPVNFTLEISLPEKTRNDTFLIIVSVKDKTPFQTGRTFMVKPDLAEIIDSESVLGNSSLVQTFDENHPQTSFSIRVATYIDTNILLRAFKNIHVYDQGVYKGNLNDVLVASNISQVCAGTQFAIVNTNPSDNFGGFSLLVSPSYGWNGEVFVRAATPSNATETFTATNGLTVFHQVRQLFVGTSTPSIYQQLSFRGDGVLSVYAGCLAGPQEERRIAFITPSTADQYENLMIFGRCQTYVLNQGVFQWTKQDGYFTDYHHTIGRKGVIMSDNYPYVGSNETTKRNYLIQAPENQRIAVKYEVAYIGDGVSFNIEQDISAGSVQNVKLSSDSILYTSVATYQQKIDFTTPPNSAGLLVRYTVINSAFHQFSSICHIYVSLILIRFFV